MDENSGHAGESHRGRGRGRRNRRGGRDRGGRRGGGRAGADGVSQTGGGVNSSTYRYNTRGGSGTRQAGGQSRETGGFAARALARAAASGAGAADPSEMSQTTRASGGSGGNRGRGRGRGAGRGRGRGRGRSPGSGGTSYYHGGSAARRGRGARRGGRGRGGSHRGGSNAPRARARQSTGASSDSDPSEGEGRGPRGRARARRMGRGRGRRRTMGSVESSSESSGSYDSDPDGSSSSPISQLGADSDDRDSDSTRSSEGDQSSVISDSYELRQFQGARRKHQCAVVGLATAAISVDIDAIVGADARWGQEDPARPLALRRLLCPEPMPYALDFVKIALIEHGGHMDPPASELASSRDALATVPAAALELSAIICGAIAQATASRIRQELYGSSSDSDAASAVTFSDDTDLSAAATRALIPLLQRELRRLPCEGTALRIREAGADGTTHVGAASLAAAAGGKTYEVSMKRSQICSGALPALAMMLYPSLPVQPWESRNRLVQLPEPDASNKARLRKVVHSVTRHLLATDYALRSSGDSSIDKAFDEMAAVGLRPGIEEQVASGLLAESQVQAREAMGTKPVAAWQIGAMLEKVIFGLLHDLPTRLKGTSASSPYALEGAKQALRSCGLLWATLSREHRVNEPKTVHDDVGARCASARIDRLLGEGAPGTQVPASLVDKMQREWARRDAMESSSLRAIISELQDCLQAKPSFAFMVVQAFGLQRCLRLLVSCSSRPELEIVCEALRLSREVQEEQDGYDGSDGAAGSSTASAVATELSYGLLHARLAASFVNSYAGLEEGTESQVTPLRAVLLSLLVAADVEGGLIDCIDPPSLPGGAYDWDGSWLRGAMWEQEGSQRGRRSVQDLAHCRPCRPQGLDEGLLMHVLFGIARRGTPLGVVELLRSLIVLLVRCVTGHELGQTLLEDSDSCYQPEFDGQWTAERLRGHGSDAAQGSLLRPEWLVAHQPLRNIKALASMDFMSVRSCRLLLSSGMVAFLCQRVARCLRGLAFDVAGSWDDESYRSSEDEVHVLLKKGEEWSVRQLLGSASQLYLLRRALPRACVFKPAEAEGQTLAVAAMVVAARRSDYLWRLAYDNVGEGGQTKAQTAGDRAADLDAVVGGFFDDLEDVDEDVIGGALMDVDREGSGGDAALGAAAGAASGAGSGDGSKPIPGTASGPASSYPSVKHAHEGLASLKSAIATLSETSMLDHDCVRGREVRLPRGEPAFVMCHGADSFGDVDTDRDACLPSLAATGLPSVPDHLEWLCEELAQETLRMKTLAAAAGLLGSHASSADLVADSSTDAPAASGRAATDPLAAKPARFSLDSAWLRDWRHMRSTGLRQLSFARDWADCAFGILAAPVATALDHALSAMDLAHTGSPMECVGRFGAILSCSMAFGQVLQASYAHHCAGKEDGSDGGASSLAASDGGEGLWEQLVEAQAQQRSPASASSASKAKRIGAAGLAGLYQRLEYAPTSQSLDKLVLVCLPSIQTQVVRGSKPSGSLAPQAAAYSAPAMSRTRRPRRIFKIEKDGKEPEWAAEAKKRQEEDEAATRTAAAQAPAPPSSLSHHPQAEAAAYCQAAPLPITVSSDVVPAQALTLKYIRRSVSNESRGPAPDASEGVDVKPRAMPDMPTPSSASLLVVTVANCARDPCKAISEARPTHPSVVRLFQRRSTAIQELADNDEAGELPPMMGFLADIPRVMPLSSRISYVSSLTSDHDEREVGLFEGDIDRIARGEDFRQSVLAFVLDMMRSRPEEVRPLPTIVFKGEEGAGPGPSREGLVLLANVLFSTEPVWRAEVDAKIAAGTKGVKSAEDVVLDGCSEDGTSPGHPVGDALLWALPLFKPSPDGRHVVPVPSECIPWGQPVPGAPKRWVSAPRYGKKKTKKQKVVKEAQPIRYPRSRSMGIRIRQALFKAAGRLLGMSVLSRQPLGVALPQIMTDFLRFPAASSIESLIVGSGFAAADAFRQQLDFEQTYVAAFAEATEAARPGPSARATGWLRPSPDLLAGASQSAAALVRAMGEVDAGFARQCKAILQVDLGYGIEPSVEERAREVLESGGDSTSRRAAEAVSGVLAAWVPPETGFEDMRLEYSGRGDGLPAGASPDCQLAFMQECVVRQGGGRVVGGFEAPTSRVASRLLAGPKGTKGRKRKGGAGSGGWQADPAAGKRDDEGAGGCKSDDEDEEEDEDEDEDEGEGTPPYAGGAGYASGTPSGAATGGAAAAGKDAPSSPGSAAPLKPKHGGKHWLRYLQADGALHVSEDPLYFEHGTRYETEAQARERREEEEACGPLPKEFPLTVAVPSPLLRNDTKLQFVRLHAARLCLGSPLAADAESLLIVQQRVTQREWDQMGSSGGLHDLRESVQCSFEMLASMKTRACDAAAMRDGFSEMVTRARVFSAAELQAMFRGSRSIDVRAWRAASRPHPPNLRSPVLGWLWDEIGGMDEALKRALLRFWTGSSTPPVGGFRSGVQMEGKLKVCVSHQSSGGDDADGRLPKSSTCDLQLQLPAYSSRAVLGRQLRRAIEMAGEGYGLL